MKKLLLALLSLIIISICACVFYFIPVGFHHAVHQELIAEHKELRGSVEYQKIGFHTHKSSFVRENEKLGTSFKIDITTVSGLNPEDYHFDIKATNTQKEDESYEFSIHYRITDAGKVRFLIKTQDFIKKKDENILRLISPVIKIGDFAIVNELLEHKSLFELAMNKEIVLSFKELSGEFEGDSHQIKGFEFQVQTQKEDDKITLKASGSSENYLGVMVNQPVLYKQAKSSFSIGTFNYERAQKFVEDFLGQASPLQQQNMLVMMSALGSIEFPVDIETHSSGLLGTNQARFNLKFQLKNKNFLDMNNYFIFLESLNNRENTVKILNDTFIREYLKKRTDLKTKQESNELLKKLRIDVNNNKDLFLDSLIKFDLLKEENSFYLIKAMLDSGIVKLHTKQIPVSQIYSLPYQVVDDFIQSLK